MMAPQRRPSPLSSELPPAFLLLLLLPFPPAGAAAAAAAEAAAIPGSGLTDANVTALDCMMRRLALRYAARALPRPPPRGGPPFGDGALGTVRDALRLDDLCGLEGTGGEEGGVGGIGGAEASRERRRGEEEEAPASEPDPEQERAPASDPLPPFCDSAAGGSGGGGGGPRRCAFVSPSILLPPGVLADGSIDRPVGTIREALALTRSASAFYAAGGVGGGGAVRTAVVLRGGVHSLDETVTLGSEDSGLTVRGYPGEEAWISGGVEIPDGVGWRPSSEDGRVWVANLTDLLGNSGPLPSVASVFTTSPHRRLIRARYPNSDPETDQWGYASPGRLEFSIPADVVTEWHEPPPGPPPNFTFVDLTDPPHGVPPKNDSAMAGYNAYASGSGGVCAGLWGTDADSYWCSNASEGGWAEVDREAAVSGRLQIPVGMSYDASVGAGRRMDGWGDGAAGGIVHAWHSQSWSMHMFEIESRDGPGRFRFKAGGGRQGGRNWCRCDQCTYAGPWCGQNQDPPDNDDRRLIGGTFIVENVLAELDEPGEFFFDRSSNLLYVMPNATDADVDTSSDGPTAPAPADVPGIPPVPQGLRNLRFALLETLIFVRGARNVTISGVGFRDSAATYLGDWSAPSGGDWAMHRGGALFVEGAEGVSVRGCAFRRLDGNAVFLSRRVRGAEVVGCTFEWIGESAIATWGETSGYDATGGDQPRGTEVRGNVMRELGIYQKQSSAFGQAKAALSAVRDNVMFNMPRAAINFNDMMGGGDAVERNLIFNTCRESGDHGPINSWDRQPFMTRLRDGRTDSFDPLPRTISHNFIFANYGASQAVDNDDGSSWFSIHDNVFYASEGFKMDYGGHDSVFSRNLIMAYPYDGQQCISLSTFKPGHGHVAIGNRCIVGLGNRTIGSGCGDPSCANAEEDTPESLEVVVKLGRCNKSNVDLRNNSYYTPNGTAVFLCGDDGLQRRHRLEDMQDQYGLELGSEYGKTPSDEILIQWAKSILFESASG